MDSIGTIETFFIDYFHIRNRKKFTYRTGVPSLPCTLVLFCAADFSEKEI
jgi:hypothetical protein